MANAKSELCRRYDAVLKAVAALDRTYYLDSRPSASDRARYSNRKDYLRVIRTRFYAELRVLRCAGKPAPMATKMRIIVEIQSRVGSSYGIWRIGLTHDLAERKAYWEDTEKQDVTRWHEWAADSLSDAKGIESHFTNKGMGSCSGDDLSTYKAVDVYVF
jgi:hypothetical protein